MRSSRWVITSLSAPRKSLLIGGALIVAVGLTGVGHQVLTSTANHTPVAAAPAAPAERGGEGPSVPQTPTVVTVRSGKTKPLVMSDLPGFTLYTFSADDKRKSKCKKECVQRWRPVVSAAGKPQAGAGAAPPEIGSILRDDGSFQVTFDDRPVYYFVDDRKPGDEEGTDRDEFGGKWSPEPPRGKNSK